MASTTSERCDTSPPPSDVARRLVAVHVVPSLDVSYGGPAVSVPMLAAAMRADGVDAALLSVDAEAARNPLIDRLQLDWRRCPPSSIVPGYHSRAIEAQLDTLHRAAPIDVVHVHSMWSFPLVIAARWARRAGVPLVLSPRSELYAQSLRKSALRKWIFRRLLARRALADIALLHATEPVEASAARAFGVTAPIATVANGVDFTIADDLPDRREAKRESGLDPDRPTVLFLSRLHPRKNPAALIRAWQESGMAAAGWQLVIAGGTENPAYLRELQRAVAPHYAGEVRWPGHVAGRGKQALLAACDLFVLPTRFENFGIAIAEALACSRPVVTTDATPWAEITKTAAGAIVGPDDASGLSEALRRFMGTTADERTVMGERARVLVSRYTWPAAATAMSAAYQTMTNERE